jgi:hypothetical protein
VYLIVISLAKNVFDDERSCDYETYSLLCGKKMMYDTKKMEKQVSFCAPFLSIRIE